MICQRSNRQLLIKRSNEFTEQMEKRVINERQSERKERDRDRGGQELEAGRCRVEGQLEGELEAGTGW